MFSRYFWSWTNRVMGFRWGVREGWKMSWRESELRGSVCVSRERRLALLQRDADHRLRGCCGIKGFVSQSPLTLSSQCRLQVLRQPWTRNNSWPQRLTLECPSSPATQTPYPSRIRQRIWGSRVWKLPLSASRHNRRAAGGFGSCSSALLSVLTHT